MPIYEYRCDSCQHIFEELQRYNDPAPEVCPKCEKSPVRRLISNTTFHLKGGGWYATDNPPKTSASSSNAEASASTSIPASTDVGSSAAPARAETATSSQKSTEIEA